MNRKGKVGTVLLTTSLLGTSAQTVTSNLASAASIKEVLSKTTKSQESIFSSVWKKIKKNGSVVAASIIGGVVGGALGYFAPLSDSLGKTKFAAIMASAFALAEGVGISYFDADSLKEIKQISHGELNSFKRKINIVAYRKADSENKQKIYADKEGNCLIIGIETAGNAESRSCGPILKIDISSKKAKVTFQENGVNSKEEEIKYYEDLAQKLGNMLHKVYERTWAFLDHRTGQNLGDIRIKEDAHYIVYGHPLQRILSFLEKHKDIMKGTVENFGTNRNFVKLITKRDGEESQSKLPIMSYEILTDDPDYTFRSLNEYDVIYTINSFLASKNLKDDYRLKLREDNAGNYKLSLYKGEPSKDTYVGDIEDEEDVKILKGLEVPKAKKYIAFSEKIKTMKILIAYMEKCKEEDKKILSVYSDFCYLKRKLFLDETNHKDSDGKSENRLFFVGFGGKRFYVLEPEDIKGNKDAQIIKEGIINIIKEKYEK